MHIINFFLIVNQKRIIIIKMVMNNKTEVS